MTTELLIKMRERLIELRAIVKYLTNELVVKNAELKVEVERLEGDLIQERINSELEKKS